MRYYEITHRPRTQTATHRIAWNEPRHLQHDARGIWQRAQACVCLAKLTEPSHILLMRIVTIAFGDRRRRSVRLRATL